MNYLRRLIAKLLGDPMLVKIDEMNKYVLATSPCGASRWGIIGFPFVTMYRNIDNCSHCGSTSMEPDEEGCCPDCGSWLEPEEDGDLER